MTPRPRGGNVPAWTGLVKGTALFSTTKRRQAPGRRPCRRADSRPGTAAEPPQRTLLQEQRQIVSHQEPGHVREDIARLLKYAPPEMRAAVLGLLPAAKRTLDSGYHPDVRRVPLKSWRCLLQLLASVTSMQSDTETLLRVSNDLLSIADRMAPPGEVLRQSAEVLVHALHADLYVCRLRNAGGEWVTQAANHVRGDSIPIVAPMLDESLRKHPVMSAVLEGHVRYVVSNNLQGLDRGGGSFDCVVYKEGYRSRLAFVLRERNDRARLRACAALHQARIRL